MSSQGSSSTSSLTCTYDEDEEIQNSSKKFARGNILIVDDSDLVRMAIGFSIQHLGFRPIYATDGLDALNQIESMSEEDKELLKMVITDCHMPNMNGFKLSSHLNSLMIEGSLPKIPIIAQTGIVNADVK